MPRRAAVPFLACLRRLLALQALLCAVLPALPSAAADGASAIESAFALVYQIKTAVSENAPKASYGSGFVIAADGLVATNFHVVAEALHEPDKYRIFLVDGASVTTDADSLAKVKVTAEVIGNLRGPKIIIQKYKNKTGYKKRQGHRQKYTQVKVTDISL